MDEENEEMNARRRKNGFWLLNMTGRRLNGIGEKYNVVDLSWSFQRKLEEILLGKNGLFNLLNYPKDELNSTEFFLGMTSEDAYNLMLRKKIELFYNLIILVMRHNIPHLRFKILIDQEIPLGLLVDFLRDSNMDLRLEIMQILFLDKNAQASSMIEPVDVLGNVIFRTNSEILIRPFEKVWCGCR
ncbi:MAG: hypothetical protein WC472_02585 [Candidatus Paceibacterota bacterium]